MPEYLRDKSNFILDVFDIEAGRMRPNTRIKYEDYASYAKAMKKADPSYIVDSVLEKKIERLAKKQASDYTNEQLLELQDTIREIFHEQTSYLNNKRIAEIITIETASSEVAPHVKKVMKEMIEPGAIQAIKEKTEKTLSLKGARLFHLEPHVVAKEMTSWASESQLYDSFVKNGTEGTRNGAIYLDKVVDEAYSIMGDINFKSVRKHKYKAQLDSGKHVDISGFNKINVILGWDDIDWRRHVKEGVGQGVGHYGGVKYKLTQNDINNMIKTLSPQEERFIKAYRSMVRPDSTFTNGIDETYFAIKGRRLDLVEGYVPINTDTMYMEKNILNRGGKNLANAPFTQPRNKSTMPIIWEEMDEVFERMVFSAKNYVSFAEASKEINFILSNPTFVKTVSDKIGKEYLDFFERYLRKMNGQDGLFDTDIWLEKILIKGLTRVKGALLLANMTTGVKQTFSFISAVPEIGAKYLSHAFKKTDWGTVYKNSPLLKMRDSGMFTADMEQVIALKKHQLFKKHGWFMRKGDKFAMGRIWNMSEAKIKDTMPNLKIGSDEFWEQVARESENAVYRSQPNVTLFQRTPAGIPRNFAESLYGMFGTQTRKNFNMAYEAFATYKQNPSKSIETLIALGIANIGIASVTYNKAKFAQREASMGIEILKTFSASLPGGKIAVSTALYGADFPNPVEDSIEALYESVVDFIDFDSKTTRLGKIKNFATAAATLSGKPARNIERQLIDVAKNISPEGLYEYESVWKAKSNKDIYESIYKAIAKGDLSTDDPWVRSMKKNIDLSEGEPYKTSAFERMKSSMISKSNSDKHPNYTDEQIKEVLRLFEDKDNNIEYLPEFMTVASKKEELSQYGLSSDDVDTILIEIGKVKGKEAKIDYLWTNYPGKPAEIIYDVLFSRSKKKKWR